jgi:asparagine synthase (glutamine-hydrolysing)
MSGFAGIIHLDGAPVESCVLQRMTDFLKFRGPDATQIWSRGGAGFSFTLLRTGPAPQSSEQPCTLNGRVWLLGDVRLDGREDLRLELEQSEGPIPATTTDEGLILLAWRQWGEAGLAKLLGDFSFAIWDETAKRLCCVRDLVGTRPFFYAQAGAQLSFSNTLDVLRRAPGVSSELNSQFIGDFLLREWCQDGQGSVYRDIRRLPAGQLLTYSRDELCVRRFTNFPVEAPLLLKRPEEYVEQFQELLETAVRDRLPQRPSAILLSGGLDSTSLAAVACKIATKNGASTSLRALTVDCRALFDDQEGSLASLVAERLGIEIEILSAASCPPYQGWEDPRLRAPEPYIDPFLLLTRNLYRRVRDHSPVVISGYGGDDILTGQAWPYLTYLFRKGELATIVKKFGRYIFKNRSFPPLRGGFRTTVRRWMGHTDPLAEFPAWLNPDFVERQNLRARWQELQEPSKPVHPLHPLAYAGLSNRFWSSVIECEDAAWTGAPVELRAPFLDKRLLRFLLRVPPVPWCMKKTLLREAMRGMLPEEIRTRPKTPLLDDLVQRFIDRKEWQPLPLPEPPIELREFVDWERLATTLATATGSTLWVCLRAVSLAYWLKGVVNEERIR